MTDLNEDEFYDDTTVDFPSVKNLAPGVRDGFGPGRLVAIWAISNGEAPGKRGKPYGYTETVTLALDDGPDSDRYDELVGRAPSRVAMRHSTGYIHTKLKDRVTGKNGDGVPLRWRPLIGRVNTQPSNDNEDVAAFGLAPKEPSDVAIIQRHKALIISINKEMEANEAKAEDKAAFE